MSRPPKFGHEERERLFKQGLRRCTRCEKIKSLSEFYKRSDGHSEYTSHCKECTAIRVDAYHKTPRGREITRIAMRRYFKTEKGKKARKRWEENNQLKKQAHHAIGHAIEYGRITRPDKCSKCGCACIPEAHHWQGYNPEHWLNVQWLCFKCHREVHHS